MNLTETKPKPKPTTATIPTEKLPERLDCPECEKYRGFSAFHEIDARKWRELFEEQRGGTAFNSIQTELVKTRSELQKAKQELAELKAKLNPKN